MNRTALALLLALAAGAAHGVTPIYRCGQSYSQTPCPGGKLVDSSDPRSAAQRAEARRVTEREKNLATRMERDRLGKDAASAPATATGFDSRAPASAPRAASAPKGKKKAAKGARPASGADIVVITPRPKAAAN